MNMDINMNIDFIYFYKKDGVNIPLMIGSTNDVRSIFNEREIEQMEKDFPDVSRDHLYVLIGHTEFKISA